LRYYIYEKNRPLENIHLIDVCNLLLQVNLLTVKSSTGSLWRMWWSFGIHKRIISSPAETISFSRRTLRQCSDSRIHATKYGISLYWSQQYVTEL